MEYSICQLSDTVTNVLNKLKRVKSAFGSQLEVSVHAQLDSCFGPVEAQCTASSRKWLDEGAHLPHGLVKKENVRDWCPTILTPP